MAPGILARGPWSPDQVTARWAEESFEPTASLTDAADAAVAELADRGSPSHDGIGARFISHQVSDDGQLLINLQPSRWSLRLNEQDAANSVAALCAVRDAEGRWLAGRRAQWLASWPGRESTFHLRLDPGPAAAPDAVECRPRLRNAEQLRRDLMDFVQRESQFFNPNRSRETVNLLMLVDRRGEVVFATLSRRGMEPLVDRALLQMLRRQSFDPATAGGVPIDVWVELPLQMGAR